jgi:hypothetical protein
VTSPGFGEPDFIVLRAAADLPPGFMPEELDGRWMDRSQIPVRGPRRGPLPPHLREAGPGAVAVPTGRFEVRGYDGAVAEVWEFQV